MDPVLAPSDLVRRLPEGHRLNERLNEAGGLVTDEVGTEQAAIAGSATTVQSPSRSSMAHP